MLFFRSQKLSGSPYRELEGSVGITPSFVVYYSWAFRLILLKFIIMSDDLNLSLNGGADPSTFKFAKELRLRMTPSEEVLWKHLKDKNLGHKFRRQHPFGKYILDFYCHALRMSIEIDGEVHLDNEQKKLDEFRTNELKRCNIKELRFTNDQVNNKIQTVLMKIRKEIIKIETGA